ncbi:MAG: MIP/aquaporin family protein, partial [Thermomicrobiales bacterium]
MIDRDLWRASLAEFLGPFTLVVAAVGAIISTQNLSDGGNLVAVALAHGLAIGLMVAALGHVSGGHFNPAVTIGMLATGEVGVTRAVSYIIAQLVGGLAGAAILTVIFPALGPMGRNNTGVNLGVLGLGPDVTVAGAVIMEVVMTFFLVLVIFGTAVDPRGPKAIAGLVIGLTITMDILAGGRVTGAAMNPARAFGPALVQQDFTNWWIYWVGPIIGGLIAAFAYKYFWLSR